MMSLVSWFGVFEGMVARVGLDGVSRWMTNI